MDDSQHNSIAQHVVGLGSSEITDNGLPYGRFNYGIKSRFTCGGKEFVILMTDDPPPGCDQENAIEVEWARQGSELTLLDHNDIANSKRHDRFLDEMGEKIRQIAIPTLLKLSPPLPGAIPPKNAYYSFRPKTAQEHFCPDYVELQLVTRNGRLELIPGHHSRDPGDVTVPFSLRDLRDLGLDELDILPNTFPAADVLLTSRFHSQTAFEASVAGLVGVKVVCEMLHAAFNSDIARQIKMLTKIRKAHLDAEVRVPALRGKCNSFP